MPLLIDGYNLLFAVRKSFENNEDITEVGLCRVIVEYLRVVRRQGCIVFDGTGPANRNALLLLKAFKTLEVVFAGTSREADDVIEQKISDNTAPRSLIVVSSDRRLRRAASRRKAISVASDVFWKEAICRIDRGKRSSPEPPQKQAGITQSETDRWLKYFGL